MPPRLPFITSCQTSVLVVLASFAICTLFNTEDLALISAGLTWQPTASETKTQGESPSPSPGDMTSLMQGTHIHVELFGKQNKQETPSAHSGKQRAKDVDDLSLFSGIPIMSKIKTKPSDLSLVSQLQAISSLGVSSSWRIAFRRVSKQNLAELAAVASTSGLGIVLLILLIGCTCIAACSIACPKMCPWTQNRQAQLPDDPVPETTQDHRQVMLSPKQLSAIGAPNQYQSPAGTGRWGITSSPFASALMPTPGTSLEQVLPPVADQMQQEAAPKDAQRPPPLCPSLLMPLCEARFGIPMHELAQLGAEGDLNIVGLSGNPLLRAVVRKIATARTLEISMPEQNSAPRATISPSTSELAGHGQQGCRALEIRGMRGAFYGILEMRGSGACYVVRDGKTVLTLDGDAESLQLSIKSSVGLPLASVRCSAEPFGGVDHVEVRVEAGVDTVLILSVVLAVLLLSPYLPPATQ